MPYLLYSDEFLNHETGEHPECSDRLRAIHRRLDKSGWLAKLPKREFAPATAAQLGAVHTPQYVAAIAEYCRRGGGRVEQDTVVSRGSAAAAQLAAGAVVAAVDAVLAGPVKQALCLVRPPGHHALADGAMGFCLFNNIAVGAMHAIHKHRLDRVLIVDWDVHHGNGTQDMFFQSEQVWFFSAHRFPFYPGSGDADETGTGKGLGTKFNLPLAFGISRKEYREKFASLLDAAVTKCRPQLLLLSAGFDAHAADPIGSLGLETEDFGTLTKLVQEAADTHCQGRWVSVLEGGYNLEKLAESVQCHVESLPT